MTLPRSLPLTLTLLPTPPLTLTLALTLTLTPTLTRRVASPPVLGITAGLVLGLTPPLHWLCISEGKHRAPLGFAIQAASVLGDAAIPINTMLLGASLARGPAWRAVSPSLPHISLYLPIFLYISLVSPLHVPHISPIGAARDAG